MAGRKKTKLPFDSRGGVVTIQRRLLNSDAYLGLSPWAKSLIHLMQRHWRHDEPVGFSVRQAQAEIPCSKDKAMEVFKELQEAGFIRLVDESLFCSRTQSKSRTWRLTWLPYNYHYAPTNDWEKPTD